MSWMERTLHAADASHRHLHGVERGREVLDALSLLLFLVIGNEVCHPLDVLDQLRMECRSRSDNALPDLSARQVRQHEDGLRIRERNTGCGVSGTFSNISRAFGNSYCTLSGESKPNSRA